MKINFKNKTAFFWILMGTLITAIICTYFNFGAVSVMASVALPVLFVVNILLAFYAIFKKRYVFVLGVILFLCCYPFFFQLSSKSVAHDNSISIMSYNVKAFSGNNEKISSDIVQFIKSLNPDILLLQESTYKIGREITGYDYHFLGYRDGMKKSLLDIYSKYPIVNKGFVDFPNTYNNSIFADLSINNGIFRVYNLHLQSFAFTSKMNVNQTKHKLSETLNKQIEQVKIVKHHISAFDGYFIIAGDLNTTPFSKPYRLISENLNDSFICKGNGFGNTFNLKGYPLRLDYAFLDKSLKVTNHKNFKLNLSDHEPIYVEFKIPKSGRS